jgi:hypothetical protein
MGQITIRGRCPSKKNSRINTRSGRSFPSVKYTAWHREASQQLLGQPQVGNKDITLQFWFPDNRKTDLTNKAESIMDLLVDNFHLTDDRWQETGPVHLIPMGVDKNNPRCVISWK